VCLFLGRSHEAYGFQWNCQATTQAPGVGSNGPVTFTFGGTAAGQTVTLPAFTCDAIDHSVKTIPGGVPPQLHFVPGPQGIDPQELLALAGIPPDKRSGVSGIQISCTNSGFSFAAGYKRPGQPVTLTPTQIADTAGDAVFIEPNGVPGASWFVDPTKPYDRGTNWFSCLYGWAIEIDLAKAPTLVVPTPVAAPTQAAAGTTPVAFSLPSAVTTSGGAPVSSQLQYSWTFGDGTPPAPYSAVAATTHLFHQAGSYAVTVTVEDQQGAYGLSAPVKVTVTAPQLTVATPSVSPDSVRTTGAITGTPVTFSTSATLNGTPDTNILSYQWSFGDGGSSTEASPTYAYKKPGTYAVRVSVTDKSLGGPSGTTVTSATLYVQANAAGGLTVAQPTFSPGAPLARQPVQLSVLSVSLNGAPDTNPLTYQWSYGDGTPPETTSGPTTHTYACQPTGACFGGSSAAIFKVSVTVTDSSVGQSAISPTLGLTVSDSGPLVMNAPTVDPKEVSLGTPVQFSAPAVTLNGAQDTNFLGYKWSFSDGGSSTAASPSYTFTQTGPMTAMVVITDTAGNTGTSPPVTVLVDPPKSPGTRAQSVRSQTVAFTSTAPSGATIGGPTYAVAAHASSGLPVSLSVDPSASSICRLTGTTVSFIGSGLCVIDADQAGSAAYLPAPQVQQSFAVQAKLVVSAPTATLTTGQTFQLQPGSVTLNGAPDGNGLTYAWTLGDGTTSTDTSPIHSYSVTGPVQVAVTVTDAAGNTGTSPTITIQIEKPTPKVPATVSGTGAGIGTGTGGGSGGGTGGGSGTGSGTGSGAGSESSGGTSASGSASSPPQSTAAPTTPATTSATTTTSKPTPPHTKIKVAPAPTVRTSPGLVGYLIQPTTKQSTKTATAQANPSTPAASGGGGGVTHRHRHYAWLLGVLLVLLVLLTGAGLESKPPRKTATGL
jgi:PKD repeat protein